MSLFDRLIIEVDTPAYQIGLLSRSRIRSHVNRARSSEIGQLYRMHGKSVIDQTLRVPVSNSGDRVTSADRQEEGDIAERKRRREDHENSAHVRKARRDRDTGKRTRDPSSIRDSLNLYFLDGSRIHREVLEKEIRSFLGPEARSRPLVYRV